MGYQAAQRWVRPYQPPYKRSKCRLCGGREYHFGSYIVRWY